MKVGNCGKCIDADHKNCLPFTHAHYLEIEDFVIEGHAARARYIQLLYSLDKEKKVVKTNKSGQTIHRRVCTADIKD